MRDKSQNKVDISWSQGIHRARDRERYLDAPLCEKGLNAKPYINKDTGFAQISEGWDTRTRDGVNNSPSRPGKGAPFRAFRASPVSPGDLKTLFILRSIVCLFLSLSVYTCMMNMPQLSNSDLVLTSHRRVILCPSTTTRFTCTRNMHIYIYIHHPLSRYLNGNPVPSANVKSSQKPSMLKLTSTSKSNKPWLAATPGLPKSIGG